MRQNYQDELDRQKAEAEERLAKMVAGEDQMFKEEFRH